MKIGCGIFLKLRKNEVMIVGFTGTQKGMTMSQLELLRRFLELLCNGETGLVIRHGGCIGADKEFDTICQELGISRIVHPSNIGNKQATIGKGNVHVLLSKPPLIRNHNIVDKSEIILAAPKERDEIIRSGTWATIRYAAKRIKIGKLKSLLIIRPEGSITTYEK